MSKFDRYMLSQLLVLFGFFALVLVAVFWINKAVRLFDRLIADGQSAMVFLEFTALGLPTLILQVIPLAAFAAAVFVTNRLSSESELTVMLATGSSPWRLARPVLWFGLICAGMTAALSHLLVPMSTEVLQRREAEISRDVTAGLLVEGTFLHPASGVTLFTREIGDDGVLRDVFLSDRRDPGRRVIYTASDAYLVRQEDAISLIMVDGQAQNYDPEGGRLSTAIFRDFSYDISGLLNAGAPIRRQAKTLGTLELLQDPNEMALETGQPIGEIVEELHARTAKPLFSTIAALVGFAALLSTGFSRLGAWREITAAFAAIVLMDGLRAVLTEMVRQDAALWALTYVPVLVGAALVVGLLAIAAGQFRRRAGVPA